MVKISGFWRLRVCLDMPDHVSRTLAIQSRTVGRAWPSLELPFHDVLPSWSYLGKTEAAWACDIWFMAIPCSSLTKYTLILADIECGRARLEPRWSNSKLNWCTLISEASWSTRRYSSSVRTWFELPCQRELELELNIPRRAVAEWVVRWEISWWTSLIFVPIQARVDNTQNRNVECYLPLCRAPCSSSKIQVQVASLCAT